ncbi:lytic transglycosylase domain-containing protein [Salarchaeum sp. III]|uniref:lytic transglycosylase domain-containing protein n=1 Tax=Salarchaeum sp. III TaxID=3107927 RepID=UPI002ED83389
MNKISFILVVCIILSQISFSTKVFAISNGVTANYSATTDYYWLKIGISGDPVYSITIDYPGSGKTRNYVVNNYGVTRETELNKSVSCNGSGSVTWLDESGATLHSEGFTTTQIEDQGSHCSNTDYEPYVPPETEAPSYTNVDSETNPEPSGVSLSDLEPKEDLSGSEYDDFKSSWEGQEITSVDLEGEGSGVTEFFDKDGNSLGTQEISQSGTVEAPDGAESFELQPKVNQEGKITYDYDPDNPDDFLDVQDYAYENEDFEWDNGQGESLAYLDYKCQGTGSGNQIEVEFGGSTGRPGEDDNFNPIDKETWGDNFNISDDLDGTTPGETGKLDIRDAPHATYTAQFRDDGNNCEITGFATELRNPSNPDDAGKIHNSVDFDSSTPRKQADLEDGSYEVTSMETTNLDEQELTFQDENGNVDDGSSDDSGGSGDSGDDSVGETCENILDIPSEYLPLYQEAAEAYGINWTLLASTHKIETSFSTMDPMVSSVGAEGHMQFMSSTWAGWDYDSDGDGLVDEGVDYTDPNVIAEGGGYGIDANGDGVADPFDIQDAVYSSAYFLADHGATEGNEYDAVFAYNNADWYVQDVLDQAQMYDEEAVSCGSEPINSPIESGSGSCDSCKVFQCPGWDDYMQKMDEIKEAIPPPPDWDKVSDQFANKIAPKVREEMENMLGEAPEPPTTPPGGDVEPLDDRGIEDKEPSMEEVPGLEDSGFSSDDVKNEAPEIEFREDESGGFDIKNPVENLPDMPTNPKPGMDSGDWGEGNIPEQSSLPQPTPSSDGTDQVEPPSPGDSSDSDDSTTSPPSPDEEGEAPSLKYYKSSPG